jgi:hypothetical protein
MPALQRILFGPRILDGNATAIVQGKQPFFLTGELGSIIPRVRHAHINDRGKVSVRNTTMASLT